MEIYSINFHFIVPMPFGDPLPYTLTHTDYYENNEAAARAAQVLRQTLRKIGSFVFGLIHQAATLFGLTSRTKPRNSSSSSS